MAEAVLAQRPRRFALPRFMTGEHPFPWLAPITVMLLAFGIYPLAYSVWLSLHKRNPVSRRLDFAVTSQWARALSDPRTWDALQTTLLYTGVALVLQLVLGMLIALL